MALASGLNFHELSLVADWFLFNESEKQQRQDMEPLRAERHARVLAWRCCEISRRKVELSPNLRSAAVTRIAEFNRHRRIYILTGKSSGRKKRSSFSSCREIVQ